MTKTYFAFLNALTRIAELKIEQLFNVIGITLPHFNLNPTPEEGLRLKKSFLK